MNDVGSDINEFVENEHFKYEDKEAIQTIMEKIRELIDDSKWNKTVKLVKDFHDFKQKDEEKSKEYIARFATMETRVKLYVVTQAGKRGTAHALKARNVGSNIL